LGLFERILAIVLKPNFEFLMLKNHLEENRIVHIFYLIGFMFFKHNEFNLWLLNSTLFLGAVQK